MKTLTYESACLSLCATSMTLAKVQDSWAGQPLSRAAPIAGSSGRNIGSLIITGRPGRRFPKSLRGDGWIRFGGSRLRVGNSGRLQGQSYRS